MTIRPTRADEPAIRRPTSMQAAAVETDAISTARRPGVVARSRRSHAPMPRLSGSRSPTASASRPPSA